MEMKSEWKSQKVEKFLQENFRDGQTKYQYRSHLKLFFNFLKVDPDTYFEAGQNYEEDVKKYWQYLMTIHAPKSIPPKLSILRSYLESNKIEFSARYWKQLTKRGLGNAVVRKDRIPTVDELRQLITLASVKDRAFFLCMASSGIRESELIQLKVEHFDFSKAPVKITIPGTIAKNKQERVTFITGEASNAVKAWMKIREGYAKQNRDRFKGLEKWLVREYNKPVSNGDMDKMFPFSESRIREHWNRALENLGSDYTVKDKTTGDYNLHLYTLRKFFNTRMKKVIPEHIVEKLMGHSGYMNGAYDRFTDEELADWYMKGQSQLYILEAPENQEAVENVKAQMERLQNQVTELLKQSPWYKQNAMMMVHEDDGKVAVPIMSDKEAVKDYTKQQKTMQEIDKDGPEIWAMKMRNEIRKKQARK